MMIEERLMNGDVLRILFADGVGFDTWVEKYANPPRVYFEGKALPMDELPAVLRSVDEYLNERGLKALWNGQIPAKPSEV